MVIRPNGTSFVHFNTHVNGVREDAFRTKATVFRNGVQTSIAPGITHVGTGHYIVQFTVPANWTGYDQAWVSFEFQQFPGIEWNACSKYAGVIGASGIDDNIDVTIERILDLLEADETYDKATGKAQKLLRGTPTVLLEKNVDGSTCVDNVRLVE